MTNKIIQDKIREDLNTLIYFSPYGEFHKRKDFLKDYIKKTQSRGLVLGISGGVDSTTAGKICQLAVEELRKENYDARFIAVRLPYGEQKDEEEAQQALRFINPDTVMTVNIKDSVDGLWREILKSNEELSDEVNKDYHKGNVKARIRMTTQYAIAGLNNMLVVGTDHAAEAISGFFTKYGDGAADIMPLSGLNKSQVKAIGKYLKVPKNLYEKFPTADLQDERPQQLDEVELGVTYDAIDAYLSGKDISPEDEKVIVERYKKTQHKRELPVTP